MRHQRSPQLLNRYVNRRKHSQKAFFSLRFAQGKQENGLHGRPGISLFSPKCIKMSQVLLSLGTNLGERRQNLRWAVTELGQKMGVTAVSPVYETEPWGKTDQPQFLNMCLVVTTDQSPRQLLTTIKQIEQDLGRTETYRWGPRLIDIDIISYDDVVVAEKGLNIPHARLAERAFVLAPLADVAPDWLHPITGKSVVEMLNAVYSTAVHQLPEPLFSETEDWRLETRD